MQMVSHPVMLSVLQCVWPGLTEDVESSSRTVGQCSCRWWGGWLGDRPWLWGISLCFKVSDLLHLSLSPLGAFTVFTAFPPWVSRMTSQRRSSAGGPRQWQVQGIRSTLSEETNPPLLYSKHPFKCFWFSLGILVLSCRSIHRLRETVSTEHTSLKQKELETMPKASHGYGGKFGVQQDRMDKVVEMLTLLKHIFPLLKSCVTNIGSNPLEHENCCETCIGFINAQSVNCSLC